MRIVDNKKLDLSDQEYSEYIKICRSYDRASFRGEEIFKGLFETDDAGQIVYIRPPSNRYTSMEAIIFMFVIANSQQLRELKGAVNKMIADAKAQIAAVIAEAKASNLK